METKDIVLLAVTLLILGEVTYLLARLPKTSLKAKDRAILVDTSVLMDGRITGIAATGFIGGTLVIPRTVIGELQYLADNADADKRTRARHGLDLVNELQLMEGIEVEILQDGSRAEEGVDDRLLSLAKRHSAVICTLDYNLNKVAVVEGIKVLNINELAQSLRMASLPGEQLTISLTQKGQDSHQGVGYLPDGTMVVVEQANNLIGQTVVVEVTRSLQTAAGRMIFAKRTDSHSDSKSRQQPAATTKKLVAQKTTARAAKTNDKKPQRLARPSTQPKTSTQNERHTSTVDKKQNSGTRPATSRHSRNNRRRDHEADLISLVNRQSNER